LTVKIDLSPESITLNTKPRLYSAASYNLHYFILLSSHKSDMNFTDSKVSNVISKCFTIASISIAASFASLCCYLMMINELSLGIFSNSLHRFIMAPLAFKIDAKS